MWVLDTSAILRTDLDFSEGGFLMTNAVLDEVREDNARLAVNAAIRDRKIVICDPEDDSLRQASSAAKKTGDLERLSETDLGVLALSLEKNAPILSDDYNIQNVASFLGLSFKKTTADGIKKTLRWSWMCSGCRKRFDEKLPCCPVCGSELKRKPVRP